MEAIVDTNVLVYEMVEDSLYHKEVLNKLKKLDKICIPTNILIEFILVLRKLGLDIEIVIDKVKEILEREDVKLIPISPSDFKEAIRIIGEKSLSLREINDKIVLAIARRRRLPLCTYDRSLLEQAKEMSIKVG